MEFPKIPDRLLDDEIRVIEPCPDVAYWVRETFLNERSELFNSDHNHLLEAEIGFLWTNVENQKQGKQILGTAELGEGGGPAWQKARREEQLDRWFFGVPDFVITLDAVFLSTADPAGICALIEHELYHCHFAVNEWGEAKTDKDGNKIWGMKPHDIEEFSGVVKRYGTAHIEEFAEAVRSKPLFGHSELQGICGTCGGRT